MKRLLLLVSMTIALPVQAASSFAVCSNISATSSKLLNSWRKTSPTTKIIAGAATAAATGWFLWHRYAQASSTTPTIAKASQDRTSLDNPPAPTVIAAQKTACQAASMVDILPALKNYMITHNWGLTEAERKLCGTNNVALHNKTACHETANKLARLLSNDITCDLWYEIAFSDLHGSLDQIVSKMGILLQEPTLPEHSLFTCRLPWDHSLSIEKQSDGSLTRWRIHQSLSCDYSLVEWLGLGTPPVISEEWNALAQYRNGNWLTKNQLLDFDDFKTIFNSELNSYTTRFINVYKYTIPTNICDILTKRTDECAATQH